MEAPSPQRADVRLGPERCNDLAEAERCEWWLANGLGGYAGGTVAGTLTRRYHGLLIAPVLPPMGRLLMLAKADVTVLDGDRRTPLFANRWAGGVLSPDRPATMALFELDGRLPVWRFEVGDAIVEQRVWMEPGANTSYLAVRLLGAASARPRQLRITLLANARDHHQSTEAGSLHAGVEAAASGLDVRFGALPVLRLRLPGASVEPRSDWYRDFELSAEQARGLGDRDNHLCVGIATLALPADGWVGVMASVEPAGVEPAIGAAIGAARGDATSIGPAGADPAKVDPGTIEPKTTGDHIDFAAALARARAHDALQRTRARAATPVLQGAPAWIDQLLLAADNFVVARPLDGEPQGQTVIAGYPWFNDWGRDTMIALPGLALATGRHDTALRLLRSFARFVSQGMLPNVFPDHGGTPAYNTVDAALWYVEAWRAYVEATNDRKALRAVFALLEDIVDWHLRGTRYGIGQDPADGLLRAGEPGLQLTWMDAKVGDWVVTPRIGKPVEVNALWFNALSTMAGFARLLRKPAARYRQLAALCRSGFQRFVKPDGSGLLDVLDGPDGDDATLRPNQILAVSLPHSPLGAADQARVVAAVERELLTPFGLRTLSPGHPDFQPRYEGGVWQRDGAYHRGTVWAWLLGAFALAEARVTGDAAAAQRRLDGLREHLGEAGLGSVSEIFDGAAPHAPRGCPAQAWSVACTLEAWCRLEALKQAGPR